MVKIGTHDGNFNCNQVLGCMLLINFVDYYKNAEIIKTRDINVLNKLDLIIDVGNEYNHKKKKYDHNQKLFNETFNENHDILLTSSSLIYKNYGIEIIKNSIKYLFINDLDFKLKYQYKLDENNINKIYIDIYEDFFEEIDGLNNRIPKFSKEIKTNYYTTSTNLSTRVDDLNCNWFSNEEGKNQKERFSEAMNLVKEDFLMIVKKHYFNIISIPLIKKYFEKRFEISKTGQIMYLEEFCNWTQNIFDLERKNNNEGLIKYIIYKDNINKYFKIQCVPKKIESFENRKSLKKEWNGKRDKELINISKIDDIIFVHHNGFIGMAYSLESVIKMGEISLNS